MTWQGCCKIFRFSWLICIITVVICQQVECGMLLHLGLKIRCPKINAHFLINFPSPLRGRTRFSKDPCFVKSMPMFHPKSHGKTEFSIPFSIIFLHFPSQFPLGCPPFSGAKGLHKPRLHGDLSWNPGMQGVWKTAETKRRAVMMMTMKMKMMIIMFMMSVYIYICI